MRKLLKNRHGTNSDPVAKQIAIKVVVSMATQAIKRLLEDLGLPWF